MSEEDKADIEDAPFEVEDKDAVLDDVPTEHDVDHVDDHEVDDVELDDGTSTTLTSKKKRTAPPSPRPAATSTWP